MSRESFKTIEEVIDDIEHRNNRKPYIAIILVMCALLSFAIVVESL